MTLFIIVIILALLFDVINGFHDAANSIATVVSTRVLTPGLAVIWAAAFNFLAYLIFPMHVADTVAKTVKPEHVNLIVISAGLCAAIFWNLLTWYYGIPSSSSHTLIGGFAGAAVASAGFDSIQVDKIMKPIYFIVLAPIIGMLVSYVISIITLHVCRKSNPAKVDKIFRRMQLFSAAAYSLGHGGNDAQKVMGIIAAAMVSQQIISGLDQIPNWVPLACYTAISLGTLFGGWRIVKTMGQKVTKLSPFEGFSAETGGAITLFATGHLGIPVSTTHTITGSIVGVGITKRLSAVKWGVTLNLVWAWILTIPVSGVIAMLFYKLFSLF
jgi:PiT family inorganic phosphate transporter